MRIRRPTTGALELDMTPMIDVVFLLLIFFLTTAQLSQMASAPVTLPQEDGNETELLESSGLIVNVMADGSIIILEKVVAADEIPALAKVAHAQDPSAVPMIRADRSASASHLNEVMDGLRRGGFRNVRVATIRAIEGSK